MFKDVTSLFDKNFAVGFFLPVVMICIFNVFILETYFGIKIVKSDVLSSLMVVAIFTWLGGVLLSVLNWRAVRFFEGYGSYNPLILLKNVQLKRFQKISAAIYETATKFEQNKAKEDKIKLKLLEVEFAASFPDEEIWLLPTRLGNAIRAFEVYPGIMYGFEGVTGWDRLAVVMSKEYVEIVNYSKAQLDFWINLRLVLLLMLIEVPVFCYFSPSYNFWPLIPVIIALISFTCAAAVDSAKAWGQTVKSGFDMFINDFMNKIGLSVPTDDFEKKKVLYSFTNSVSRRNPDLFPKK